MMSIELDEVVGRGVDARVLEDLRGRQFVRLGGLFLVIHRVVNDVLVFVFLHFVCSVKKFVRPLFSGPFAPRCPIMSSVSGQSVHVKPKKSQPQLGLARDRKELSQADLRDRGVYLERIREKADRFLAVGPFKGFYTTTRMA